MKTGKKVSICIAIAAVLCALHLASSLSLDALEEYEPYVPTANTGEILAGDVFAQELTLGDGKLESIALFVGTVARKNTSTLHAELADSTGTQLAAWDVNCLSLGDNAYYTLRLPKAVEAKNQTCTLTLTSDAKPGNAIVVYTCESEDISGLSINGEAKNASMCYKLRYRQPLPEKLKGASGFHFGAILVLAALLIAGIAFYEKLRLEKAFLIIWTGLSLMFLFASPVLNVPDEYNHFSRAYEISERHLTSEYDELTDVAAGRYLPFAAGFSALGDSWESFSENRNMILSDERVRVNYSNTAIQTPVSYIPQAVGIFVARHLTKNAAVIIYAGRLLSWLCITTLLYFALRLMPCDKQIMMLIPLLPMNIQQSVSLSPDGMVVALALFITAFVLRQKLAGPGKMTPCQYAIMYAAAVLVSLNKVVYLPFCLLFLLIPAERFGGKLQKTIHAFAAAVLTVGLNILWLMLCSGIPSRAGTNTGMQLQYILQEPLNYLLVLARSWYAIGGNWVLQSFGSSLGALNVETSALFMMVCMITLVLIAKPAAHNTERDGRFLRTVNIIIVLTTAVLIPTGIYVQWNHVYAYSIEGVQGRYFISLLIPLYYVFNNHPKADSRNTISLPAVSVWLTTGICCAIDLLMKAV